LAAGIESHRGARALARQQQRAVPDYLRQNYWWAYMHPKGVRRGAFVRAPAARQSDPVGEVRTVARQRRAWGQP